MSAKLGTRYRLDGIRNVYDSRGTDQGLQWHSVDWRAVAHEMHRRVDVSSAMGAERIGGEGKPVAFAHVLEEIEFQRRVAGIDRRRRRIEGRRGVDPSRRR